MRCNYLFLLMFPFVCLVSSCSGGAGEELAQNPSLQSPQNPQNSGGEANPQNSAQAGESPGIQIPGGLRDPQFHIPTLNEGSAEANAEDENGGNALHPELGNRLPTPGQIPGGGLNEGVQVQEDAENFAEALEAQREARVNQALQGLSLLNPSDEQSAVSLLGDAREGVGVLNVLYIHDSHDLQATSYVNIRNAVDMPRDAMDYHLAQGMLRVEKLNPSASAYLQCVRVQPGDRPRTKCQINTLKDSNSGGLALPGLRQFELEEDIFDAILDDQKNAVFLARKTNANDRFLRVIFYNGATGETAYQFLAEAGAQLNGVPRPIQGGFAFSNLDDAKLLQEDGFFYFAVFQKAPQDVTGNSSSMNVHKCSAQNGRINGNCVAKEILRNGRVMGLANNPPCFYRGTHFVLSDGRLVLMESLLLNPDSSKYLLFHQYSLESFNDPGFFVQIPYSSSTQYEQLQWVRNPQDERDFLIAGLRSIRGGSATYQLDVMTWSYQNGEAAGFHDRYENLLRYIPTFFNSFYLAAPLSQRVGPAIYVAYPLNVDWEGERMEGIPNRVSDFIEQSQVARPRAHGKVMKLQWAPFQI